MKPFSWRTDGVVLGIAMLMPTVMTWIYFVLFPGQGSVTRAIYFGSKVVMGILPLWWFWRIGYFNRRPEQNVGTDKAKPHYARSLLLGSVFGVLTFLGMMIVYYLFLKETPALAGTVEAVAARLKDAGVSSAATFLVLVVFLSIFHAAFEEYYWRWFVFGRLKSGVPWLWAAVLSSLAFMLHHVIVLAAYIPATHAWLLVPVLSLGIALGGFVWCMIYYKTGSLLGAFIAHVCADLGIMWCGFDLCRGLLS